MDEVIFEHTDNDGDSLKVDRDKWTPEGVAAVARVSTGFGDNVAMYLTPRAVRRLRKALKPYQAPKGS